jgi:dihydrofolate synthase/folylpolyglutamate synthase
LSEIKPGLERVAELLRRLGNPQKTLKFVHIAGTNGKGSTVAMLASILTEAGYRTGLFTSPYILSVAEMIAMDSIKISEARLAELREQMQGHISEMEDAPTEFEIMTALAMLYFAVENCDIVVLEVGMGGRLDATNVIDSPEVAVITAIGLDHMEFLGETVEQIAAEKAGIIKPGAICVSYPQDESVAEVIRRKCRETGVRSVFVNEAESEAVNSSLDGQEFNYSSLKNLNIQLLGEHQLLNAAVAIEATHALKSKGWRISEAALRAGLAKAKWPGRFEILRKNPVFVLDGGHNPQSVAAIVRTLKKYFPDRKITFLYGVLADKEYEAMTKILLSIAKKFVTITPNSPRALPAQELAAFIQGLGGKAMARESVERGVESALEAAGEDGIICALGSLYIIQDAQNAVLCREES